MESLEILGLVASIILAVSVSLIFGLNSREPKKPLTHAKANKKDGYKKLGEHTGEFVKPEIITLLNGKIHVALGYGLANAILIEGKEACVLIDTLESHEAARDVLAEFKKIIKKKPIEGIILTHFHADHSYGFDVFAEAYPGVKVFAHETFSYYFQQLLNVRSQITMKRAVYQFGTALENEGHENSGIGLRLR